MLIDEAYGQTAEATKVAQDGAELLFQYKVLGIFCVFLIALLIVAGFVIRHLHNKGEAKDERYVALLERMVSALEGSKDADEKVATALRAIDATFSARVQAIADLSHQFDKTAAETRHGFANISQATSGIVDLLRELRGAVMGLFQRSGGG